jgi:hypothetical protein
MRKKFLAFAKLEVLSPLLKEPASQTDFLTLHNIKFVMVRDLTTRPIHKLEGRPLSAVRGCVFDVFVISTKFIFINYAKVYRPIVNTPTLWDV